MEACVGKGVRTGRRVVLLVLSSQILALAVAWAEPVCIACRTDFIGVRSSYSDDDWGTLVAGEILTAQADGSKPAASEHRQVEASGIIAEPPARVWSVLTDFESRPKYVPGVKEIRRMRTDGNRIWLDEHLEILLIDVRYGVICTLQPEAGLVSWVLDPSVPHDIKDTSGSWQLVPTADGRGTLVQYRARIDTGQPVPGFIERFLVRRSLPQLVGGLRTEVLHRFPN